MIPRDKRGQIKESTREDGVMRAKRAERRAAEGMRPRERCECVRGRR